jgi:hypothetical protein
MDINVNLESLKKYLATPAGCEGGNISGNNWMFGIEYGGKTTIDDYQNLTIDHNHKSRDRDNVGTFVNDYPYNQRITKLAAVVHGWDIADYTKFAIETGMTSKEGEYYLGNLGAVGFRYDDEKSFNQIGMFLGLSSKQELKEIEVAIRSVMFSNWLAEHSPNCICCFGTSNGSRFTEVFAGEKAKANHWMKLDRNWYYHDVINDGRTNLFILPHPSAGGGWGLSSHHKIQVYGEMIKKTMMSGGFNIY